MASRFRGLESIEQIVTGRQLDVDPEGCWKAVVFYEEIPIRPPWLLRMLLPLPVRAAGAKSRPGARVDCIYAGGTLTKLITAIEAPRKIEFDVIDQQLGIEASVAALNGSYTILPSGRGSTILLMTRYRSYLAPRWLFRPLERLVLHALHGHVLRGLEVRLQYCSEVPDRESLMTTTEEAHAYAGHILSTPPSAAR